MVEEVCETMSDVIGPRKVERQETKTVTTWAWNCSECNTKLESCWRPSAPYLCLECGRKKEQKEGWERWSTEYPELVGARLIGGTFDGHDLQTVILETEDGRRARLEIDRGWEGGDEELIIAWEDE